MSYAISHVKHGMEYHDSTHVVEPESSLALYPVYGQLAPTTFTSFFVVRVRQLVQPRTSGWETRPLFTLIPAKGEHGWWNKIYRWECDVGPYPTFQL